MGKFQKQLLGAVVAGLVTLTIWNLFIKPRLDSSSGS